MDKLKQLFWLFLFSFLGEFAAFFLSSWMTIPGSVIGMLFLFFALHFRLIKMAQIKEAANWLTDNMAFLFIPAGVGLMTQFNILGGGIWWQLLIIIILSTLIMMYFVGLSVQSIILRQSNRTKMSERSVELND